MGVGDFLFSVLSLVSVTLSNAHTDDFTIIIMVYRSVSAMIIHTLRHRVFNPHCGARSN